MRIMITGGTGLLGKALIEDNANNHEILATYLGDYNLFDSNNCQYCNLDLSDYEAYKKIFIDFKPEVVIHTASVSSPDFAEKNREIAWKINVEATKNIIDLCHMVKAKFIFISSNGIYDGDHAPYSEDDIAKPINYYGLTKLEGETVTKKSGLIYSIVRPILMYGWPHPFERGNLLTITLKKLKERQSMNFFDDVYSNPLYVENCSEVIWKIVNDSNYGVYNIAGKDVVSIYSFVKKIADIFGLDHRLIHPVKEGALASFIKRPKNTSYNTSKMEKVLKIKPLSLETGLSRARNRLEA